MTAADRLNEIIARRRGMAFVSSREISDPLTRALYWKRRRWQAEHELEGFGWGRDPDHCGPEYLDADEDYRRAKAKHRELIQSAWFDWLVRRAEAKGRTLDETLQRLKGDTNWSFGVSDPVKLGLIEAVQGALFSTREVA